MNLLRIDNKTLSQKVYAELKQKMITAELMPGERISLRTIAAQLGVSLTPVREAIWQLERDKAVVIEHNRQIIVNQLSTDDFDELLELRLLLECRAAEVACSSRPGSAVHPAKTALQEMATSLSDSRRFLHYNHNFHMAIYQASGMKNLLCLIESLWTRVGPYIYQATTTRERMAQAMQFHHIMYDSLVARDERRMVDALRLDLTTAAAEIRPLLERQCHGAADAPTFAVAARQSSERRSAADPERP